MASVQARTAGVTQSREKEVALLIAVRKGWIFLNINQPLLNIVHCPLSPLLFFNIYRWPFGGSYPIFRLLISFVAVALKKGLVNSSGGQL